MSTFTILPHALILCLLLLATASTSQRINQERRTLSNNIFNHTHNVRGDGNKNSRFNNTNEAIWSSRPNNFVSSDADANRANPLSSKMNDTAIQLSQQRLLRTGGGDQRRKRDNDKESDDKEQPDFKFTIGEDLLHRIFDTVVLSMSTEAPASSPVIMPLSAPTKIPITTPVLAPISIPIAVPVPVPAPIEMTEAPTLAPVQLTVCDPPITLIKREEMILAILNDITPESTMLSIGTSQNKAFDWIINFDEAKLCPDRVNDIRQRYIMAVNYYSLGGDDWSTCNALTSTDMATLVPCPPPQQRHLSKANVCDWYSITCSLDGNITGVFLDDNNLVGLLPKELASLDKLLNISFYNNTMISGSIPTTYGSIPRLEELDISNNVVVGTIPTSICNGTNLRHLRFQMNEIAGTIPSCIGALSFMRTIRLDRNLLTGTIPSQISRLSALEFLSMSNNDLSGTIPSSIGTRLSSLHELSLHQNNLIGSIPTTIGLLVQIETINLIFNELNGTIPSQIGNLPNIENIFLHFNNIVGTMPESICALRDTRNGTIKQLTADCGIRAKVICPNDCCTACF